MTRVLVHGGHDIDDPAFVHNTLTEFNRNHGPISCIIHANNTRALAWQQWVSRRQVTKHLPIVANFRDGTAVWTRFYDRLFDQGRPNHLVIFQAPKQSAEELARVKALDFRAQRRDVEVHKFMFDPSVKYPVRNVVMDERLGEAVAAE